MKPVSVSISGRFVGSGLDLRAWFVVVGAAALFVLWPVDRPSETVPDGLVQERAGQAIAVLARLDYDLTTRLQKERDEAVRRSRAFEAGGPGRLQEEIGRAIVRRAQWIRAEQARLASGIVSTAEELRRFQADRMALRQERLGWAVMTAYRRHPEAGPAFLTAVNRAKNRLVTVEERVSRRLQDRLSALTIQTADLRQSVPVLYRESVRSARRSVLMRDAAETVWSLRVLDGLGQALRWQRPQEDPARLLATVRQILIGRWGVGGFAEYGIPAMVGLFVAVGWAASIVTRHRFRTVTWYEPAHETEPAQYKPLSRKEVMAMSQPNILFSWPKEVSFGFETVNEVGRYASKNGVRRAMILTDEGVGRHGLLSPVKSSLTTAGIECGVYDQVRREVPDTVVAQAHEECQRAKADLLVAVGGGSVTDTAKAVGILLGNGGKIQDYEGTDKVQRPIPRLYVVPTTAGCGSESSQFCLVLDTKRKKKIEIVSRRIIPEMIFIDPLMTMTMPSELTAGCGMDALANCIEAYFSTWASPITDALSLHAIRLISGSLRTVVANGKNMEARQNMAMAAFEAGLAYTNAQSGAVHALGHPIAGMFNVPERMGNAVLLPHVMRFNMNADMDRMVEVATALGEPIGGLSKREAAEKAITAVQLLVTDIGLPTTLDKLGVEKQSIAQLSQQALEDGFLRTNPRILNARDIERIYESAFEEYAWSTYATTGQRREMMH
jgi:alcohol dehydrogenase class IV